MEDLHRQSDLHISRDVEKRACGEARLVQCRVLVRAEFDRLRHEEPAKQLLILPSGRFERLEQHTLRKSLDILMEQGVVAENQLRREFRDTL